MVSNGVKRYLVVSVLTVHGFKDGVAATYEKENPVGLFALESVGEKVAAEVHGRLYSIDGIEDCTARLALVSSYTNGMS
jgi:hypothetical protein